MYGNTFNSYGHFGGSYGFANKDDNAFLTSWQPYQEGTGVTVTGNQGGGGQAGLQIVDTLGQVAGGIFNFLGAQQQSKALQTQAEMMAQQYAQQQQQAMQSYMGQQAQPQVYTQQRAGIHPAVWVVGSVVVLGLGGVAIYFATRKPKGTRK